MFAKNYSAQLFKETTEYLKQMQLYICELFLKNSV